MYFAIYLIIGLIVMIIHRMSKDKFDRNPRMQFFAVFPEILLLRLFLWPLYLGDLIFQKIRERRNRAQEE